MNWDVNLYNEKHGFVHQYGTDLVHLLDPKAGEHILDLGCGSGQLTNEISSSKSNVIGIDSSQEMIKSSKNLFPEIEFHQMDAQSFEFDLSFDAIFSNAVLHWVENQQVAAKNMHRHLKDGGRLVVEFGGYENVATIIEALRASLSLYGFFNNAKLERWYFPKISTYTSMLEEIGFEVVYAQLYDRPTLLDSKDDGIKDWIEMFGSHFFEGIPDTDKTQILNEVQNKVRTSCFKEGKWYADYRRIRVVAFKK